MFDFIYMAIMIPLIALIWVLVAASIILLIKLWRANL